MKELPLRVLRRLAFSTCKRAAQVPDRASMMHVYPFQGIHACDCNTCSIYVGIYFHPSSSMLGSQSRRSSSSGILSALPLLGSWVPTLRLLSLPLSSTASASCLIYWLYQWVSYYLQHCHLHWHEVCIMLRLHEQHTTQYCLSNVQR